MCCGNRYAIAAAVTAGFMYAAGALAMIYAREATLQMLAHVHYLESFGAIGGKMVPTMRVFISGLAQIMLYTYVAVSFYSMVVGLLGGGSCACPCKKSSNQKST